MTVAAYKRKWFDELYRELRGDGLSDTTIASRMGYSRSYFSQVKVAENIGDEFIDKMSSTFRRKFIPTAGSKEEATDVERMTSAEIARELKLIRHLLTAVLSERTP